MTRSPIRDWVFRVPPASTSPDHWLDACTSVASACPTSKLARIHPSRGTQVTAGRAAPATIPTAATLHAGAVHRSPAGESDQNIVDRAR